MRLKVFPITSIGLPNLKFKLRSLKTPPFIVFGSGIYNPVRFEPRKNIIMRCKNNRLPSALFSPCFLKRSRSYAGNLPVNYRCKFVKDNGFFIGKKKPCKSCPELFPVWKNWKRTKPWRNTSKPNGRKRGCNGIKIPVRSDWVNGTVR